MSELKLSLNMLQLQEGKAYIIEINHLDLISWMFQKGR